MTNYYIETRTNDEFNYNELFETLFRKYDIRRTTIKVLRDSVIIETSNFRSFVELMNMFENDFPSIEYNIWNFNEEEGES